MEAKGLMVGNYLKKEGVVVEIDARSIFDMFNDNPKYEPIQLTKVWLVLFGFELDHIFEWYDKNVIGISFKEDRMVQELEYSYNQFEIPQYVHQLQNIYFILTGEELTLK